jgi:hypothetical protein
MAKIMNKLSRQEILSILGCGSDPEHSLKYYSKNYPDLRNLLRDQIIKDVTESNSFPAEATKLSKRKIGTNYVWIIKRETESEIKVIGNNTDRGTVSEEYKFKSILEAADLYIAKSYCAGGSIAEYLS